MWIADNIKLIMLVSGALTCTMVTAVLNPRSALRSTFGETLDGPVAGIVVRNWGALIVLIGGMLLYGAYEPEVRRLVLVVAALSKIVFIGLILAHGRRFLRAGAGIAVVADAVMVTLFLLYLSRS